MDLGQHAAISYDTKNIFLIYFTTKKLSRSIQVGYPSADDLSESNQSKGLRCFKVQSQKRFDGGRKTTMIWYYFVSHSSTREVRQPEKEYMAKTMRDWLEVIQPGELQAVTNS